MGSHIEAQDNKNYTPLYYAYSAGSAEVFKYLLDNNARPFSPPNAKMDQNRMTIPMKNILMHARLVYIYKLWKLGI